MKNLLVMKFGGTSMGSAERIKTAAELASSELKKRPVLVVVSAMSKITDLLIDTLKHAEVDDREGMDAKIAELERRHVETCRELLPVDVAEETLKVVNATVDAFRRIANGVLMLGERPPRAVDEAIAFGEHLSSVIMAAYLRSQNTKATAVNARDLLVTDAVFGSASPLIEKTKSKSRARLLPMIENGEMPIVTGFNGATEDGQPTTLGRGGSDFTASLLAAVLGATELWIWTDVNGIMTTDPRIVPEAKTVPFMEYEEAAELAYFGAKVVHPSTIQPAVDRKIPVLVKNTMDPEGLFTSIERRRQDAGIRAIASKKNITLININSTRMLNAYGFLSRIFAIFEKYRTPVDLIATSEVSVSMTIDNPAYIEQIVIELEKFGYVNVEQGKAIVCLVGRNFWQDSAFVSRVFKALTDIRIRMISLGSSDINLSIVTPEDHLHDAVRKLHREFFS